jgi:hypothetical protein
MAEYEVKVAYWVRGYESVAVQAESDAEAIEKAKAAALGVMEHETTPELDLGCKRHGTILWIDRHGSNPCEAIAEEVEFDTDTDPL